MSAILAKATALEWERVREQGHASEGRQPRRVWCATELKPTLTEAEWEAAQRGVRECIMWFPGAKENMDRVDMAWSDAVFANRIDAGRALFGLIRGVESRCDQKRAAECAEWIVQLHTLQDIAMALGCWRSMGKGREPIPDIRPIKPKVRLVLIAMANYYMDCDAGSEPWKGSAQRVA